MLATTPSALPVNTMLLVLPVWIAAVTDLDVIAAFDGIAILIVFAVFAVNWNNLSFR